MGAVGNVVASRSARQPVRLERALVLCLLGAVVLGGCSDTSGGSHQDLTCTGGPDGNPRNPISVPLTEDVLINADYWDDEPSILAAGLGFTDIIGIPGLMSSNLDTQRAATLHAGGAWNTVTTTVSPVPQRAYTSAPSPSGVAQNYGWPVEFCDGLPIEFSWPVLPSTVGGSDFLVHLNDGSVVAPLVASITPNYEYNERTTVVIFGEFGNRLPPDEPGALYPVLFEIVEDETPLQLVGPGGQVVSAVGLTYGNGTGPYTAYNPGKGPTLVGAKLSRMSTDGEDAPVPFNSQIPNDGVALYGSDAAYRLRVITTGGFSPDGVRSLYPTEYESFFRVQAIDAAGRVHWIEETGVTYTIDGGSLTVLGLADLGLVQGSYDEGYIEDHDNQIDIVLAGDKVAMRAIRMVEIPASGDYSPFYNPGGPGNDPDPETVYSQPGPLTQQPVTMALDDPMTVNYPPAS